MVHTIIIIVLTLLIRLFWSWFIRADARGRFIRWTWRREVVLFSSFNIIRGIAQATRLGLGPLFSRLSKLSSSFTSSWLECTLNFEFFHRWNSFPRNRNKFAVETKVFVVSARNCRQLWDAWFNIRRLILHEAMLIILLRIIAHRSCGRLLVLLLFFLDIARYLLTPLSSTYSRCPLLLFYISCQFLEVNFEIVTLMDASPHLLG